MYVTVTNCCSIILSLAGTPIKIRGVSEPDLRYNLSTKVAKCFNNGLRTFTYLLPFVRPDDLASNSYIKSHLLVLLRLKLTLLSGASPYIFNISLRSVLWNEWYASLMVIKQLVLEVNGGCSVHCNITSKG